MSASATSNHSRGFMMLLKKLSAAVSVAFILCLPSRVAAQDDDAPPPPLKEGIEASKIEAPEASETPYRNISVFLQALQLVREHYVDKDKVSYERLMHGAMKGMLQELDPYSIYEEPERYKATMEDTTGKFAGIGVVISMKNDVLEVVAPMEDTPGFKAGIQAGDVIMEIDGKSTRRMSIQDCVNLLKGAPGTSVTLKIYRKSDDSTKDISVERAMISVSSVKGAKIIKDGIGYVRLTQFSAPTAKSLDEALKKLKAQGMKGLVIDLRGNPGGLLTSAIEVCSRFLEKGELVVFTEGRKPSDRVEYRSIGCEKFPDLPLAILVNGNSASAAEIVSGCLQDHKRAVLVGERTFGKGSVQTVVPLSDKGAVRFTTAKYYTPSKKVIHGNGVEPDIHVDVSMATEAAIAQQISLFPGEIKPASQKSVKDIQLERAIEILKGISLFQEAKRND